jgi:hypothetical protein
LHSLELADLEQLAAKNHSADSISLFFKLPWKCTVRDKMFVSKDYVTSAQDQENKQNMDLF